MNKNLFKSFMVLHEDTQRTVAEALKVSDQTISDKINGVSDFKQSEIKTLIERWGLTPEQVDNIFFCAEQCTNS